NCGLRAETLPDGSVKLSVKYEVEVAQAAEPKRGDLVVALTKHDVELAEQILTSALEDVMAGEVSQGLVLTLAPGRGGVVVGHTIRDVPALLLAAKAVQHEADVAFEEANCPGHEDELDGT
ncbi:MAG: hypothetical protein V3U22_03035, partial [Vicinamibacteria bacterium]